MGGGAGIQQISRDLREEYRSSPENEWYYTCSNGGTTTYPYGDEYQSGLCSAVGTVSGTDVSSRECHGSAPPYDQVYDLSGSTGEWINICDQGSCMVAPQGGRTTVEGHETTYECAVDGYTSLWTTNGYTGFRCCADAVP